MINKLFAVFLYSMVLGLGRRSGSDRRSEPNPNPIPNPNPNPNLSRSEPINFFLQFLAWFQVADLNL